MGREYVPLPLEYLEEMAPLTDEDFGKLVRALLLYGRDGTPVDLDGDCRFYCTRVMNKDRHYAERAAEEEEKAQKRSRHARTAAEGRYAPREGEICSSRDEHARAGNTIPNQTNPNQSIPNQSNGGGAEPEEASAAAPAIPLADGSEYCVKVKELAEWKKAYPAVNVEQELGEMRVWCLSNPTLRKTKKGVRRFINTWLSKEQDKRHTGQAVKEQAKPERAFVPSEL